MPTALRPPPIVVAALVAFALVVVAVLLFSGARDTPTPPGPPAVRPSTAEVSSAAAFAARKERYVDAVLELERGEGNFDLDAAKGLLLLDRAAATGDTSRVDEANELILGATARIADPGERRSSAKIAHGGPFTFLRIVLQFRDRPDLLHPETLEAVQWGRQPDGSVDEEASLLAYRDELFDTYTVDDINFGIERYNPWVPARRGAYNGTENHKLQTIVAGMLLAEVYDGSSYDGHPAKDDTPELDDHWHYFRDAYFRYSMLWPDDRANHFEWDTAELDEGSPHYTRTHLGDHWLLRDLHSDPIVRGHAEIFIDRTLVDWAEDLVLGVQTGYAERYNHDDATWGRTHQQHVMNYLLFDNLGYELPKDHFHLYKFSGWANLSVVTSAYNPTHRDFPLAAVDLARDKGDGYAVREGRLPHHNWVERDFSLGFLLQGLLWAESHAGSFTVYDKLEQGAGLAVIPFHGDEPIVKGRPSREADGVAGRRAAIVRHTSDDDEPKLWVQDGFDEAVLDDSGWLFVAEEAAAGRTVYLALRSATGELEQDGKVDGGRVWRLGGDGTSIWEVSTSEEHADLDAFRADVADNRFEVDEDEVVYRSTAGVELRFDRDGDAHEVDGEPVDWEAYEHSFHTPWSAHRHGTTTGAISRGGYETVWDWDPDGDGDYDEMPAKRVSRPSGG